ncbi:MAG: DMT family transporter [Ignavibacteriales bacterium]|nr:DMT family transporter [Ignavibacteriales bacterium]
MVFFGTFLGIFLQQLSLQRIPAGITQTLIATSPIFVLPISALLGEKIGIRAVLGALLAIIGVALIFVPPI